MTENGYNDTVSLDTVSIHVCHLIQYHIVQLLKVYRTFDGGSLPVSGCLESNGRTEYLQTNQGRGLSLCLLMFRPGN